MFKIHTYFISLFLISFCAICFSSCTLFRPLPLEPIHNDKSVQRIGKSDLSRFNGDYEILSGDSSSFTLDYTFTCKSLFNLKKLPGEKDYINLSALNEKHIKATLFVNDKIVKSKIVKGHMDNNYFKFHTTHFSLKYIFILYRQQTNRLALSNEEDLFLDTNSGGIGFLLIMPIPLSGSSADTYNLKFKKIK
jgi:hypothetical protein